MRPSKRGVQGIALFLIMLVISTTFYSANALAASVQVTKNSGKAGIESENHLKGWIDTDAGEEWALEVSAEMGAAADASTEVKKENVFLVRGKSEYAFDSCTKGLGNDYVCTRKELLKNPVSEQEYKFTVALKDDTGKKLAESSAASLYADGSAPEASISSITKSGEGEYKAVFSVEEVPVAFCSGIEKVQLLEGENVLKEVSLETGKEECSFTGEEAFTFAFSGTEQKYFKVKAVDRLGHESISSSFPYFIDATKPQVVTETVAFSTGEFVSEKLVSGTVRVNVAEDTKLAKVVLANAELGFTDEEGSCEKIEGTVHTCMWEFADKVMAPEMTLTFTATDSAGNTASATTKKTFSLDVTAPAITFFGSSKVFEEVSYIKKEDNTIVALIEESGSGISKESVRTDLSEVGRGEYEMPDECTQQENTPASGQVSGLWRCVWEAVSVSGQSSSYTVRLVSLTDNANNEASGATAELKFDSVLPVVKSLAMAALGEGAAGTEKEFVQAGDLLRLAFSIEEVNGISIAIDAGGFVTDAKTTYPEGILTLNQDDPEAACERDEEKNLWNCVVEFVGVSGTEFKAPLHVSVTDTAGNAAKAYEKVSENMDCKETISTGSFKQCTFDLFGIKAEEAVPDIWEVKSVKQLNEFVDMDTTALAYAVAPMEVRLKTGKENAKARLVTLAGCAPAEEDAAFADAGNHKNQLIYGNAYLEGVEDPKPKIVLQFNTFDAKEFFEEDIEAAKEEKGKFDFALVNYICTLKVFSTVGNLAYEQPETEQFSFLVKFGFSELGTATANLDEQIKVAKEEVESGFYGAIGKLNTVLKVLDYTAGFLSNLLNLIDVIALIFKGATDTARSIPAVGTAAAVSACFGLSTVQSKAAKSLEFLRIPTAILSCNEEYSLVGKKFHKSVLDTYTQWITAFGAGGVGPQAEQIRRGSFSSPISVRENILLSTVSLCIPGIVENLNDLREVKCRYVYCLENEVKSGLATVESCNELQGLLTCKYVTGELWEVIPFALFWDSAVESLKKALADPLALARTSFIVGCAANCVQSGQLSGFCDKVHFIIRVADTIESTVAWVRGIIQELKTGGGTGYCDLIS